jgi:hypothetical protein
MSHLRLWRYLQKQGVEHGLVFEDDALPAPELTLTKVLQTIKDSMGFHVLLLGHCGFSLYKWLGMDPTNSRVSRGQCMHAYAVSKAGIDSLLRQKQDFTIAVDEMLESYCTRHLCYLTRHLDNQGSNIFAQGFFHQDNNMGSDVEKV